MRSKFCNTIRFRSIWFCIASSDKPLHDHAQKYLANWYIHNPLFLGSDRDCSTGTSYLCSGSRLNLRYQTLDIQDGWLGNENVHIHTFASIYNMLHYWRCSSCRSFPSKAVLSMLVSITSIHLSLMLRQQPSLYEITPAVNLQRHRLQLLLLLLLLIRSCWAYSAICATVTLTICC